MKNDKELDSKIQEVLLDEMTPSDDFLQRLEAHIDTLESEEQPRKTKLFRRLAICGTSVAAVLVMCIWIADLEHQSKYPGLVYNEKVGSEERAEELIDKALRLASANLNKGKEAIVVGEKELDRSVTKLHNILNKVRK